MYLKNAYYLEAIKEEDIKYKARIKLNDITIENSNIKNIKYDLNINDGEKFKIGGVYGATVTLNLLNYDEEYNNFKFENKEFPIELRPAMDSLYTVYKFHKEKVGIINKLKIKYLTSLWIPQGKFYPTEITKNENKTITIKLIDKTKYLEDEYICNLTPPFTLKQLYDDVHKKVQISTDTKSFYNQDEKVNTVPVGYTYKQILGYIAECACGVYIINRLGNSEIKTYETDSIKNIEKGMYKQFLPAENYITIQKVKYAGSNIIGSEKGYVLELEEKNPFITNKIAQNILLKMQGFTFIPFTYKATVADCAMDIADMFDITNTNNTKYLTYIMGNTWEFNGALTQTWTAKGENELNNTYSSKGPINQQIENIVKEQIPNAKQEAIDKATELLTKFNGGYVVKKDGELFIADNEDIDKAQHIWRWNINGLGYSSTGIDGPYGLAMTMDGKIVADFITTGTLSADVIKANSIGGAKIQNGTITAEKIKTGAITADMIKSGTMTAERINGGTLKLGGNNNTNGSIQVVDANGKYLVTISKDGLILSNGTKLIGNGGVLSNLQFLAKGVSEVNGDTKSAGEYWWLGFIPGYVSSADKYSLYIDISVPSNFTITSAYLTLRHIPIKMNMRNGTTVYGYVRNVKAYIADMSSSAYVEGDEQSEYQAQLEGIYYNEISSCFNNSRNNFTAAVPSASNLKVTEVTSKDIASKIKKKCRIKIATTNSIPSAAKDCFAQTGFVWAAINIYGYLQ